MGLCSLAAFRRHICVGRPACPVLQAAPLTELEFKTAWDELTPVLAPLLKQRRR